MEHAGSLLCWKESDISSCPEAHEFILHHVLLKYHLQLYLLINSCTSISLTKILCPLILVMCATCQNHVISLLSSYLPSQLFKNPNHCFSLNKTHEVSYPYKTTVKITVIYVFFNYFCKMLY